MLIRRIAASACALCLAVPAVATAKDVRYVGHTHHATAVLAVGDTKGDLPGAISAVPPGDTKHDLSATVSTVPPGDTKGDLPGSVASPATHNTAVAPRVTSQPTASTDDVTNGWRLAAVIEGGLLAAFAIGAAVFMTGRQHRAHRMGV
jgi:serine/threonine protein kinase HipA of HipAB toxin-antitoxin module